MSKRREKQRIKLNPAIGIIRLFNKIIQELGEKISFIQDVGIFHEWISTPSASSLDFWTLLLSAQSFIFVDKRLVTCRMKLPKKLREIV